MRILISGSHGMIGSAVIPHLIEFGHRDIRLVRHAPGPGEVWWDPDGGKIDTADLEAFDLEPQSGGSMPAFLVRLVMGEMGEEFVLASRRVQPAKLLAAGYRFRFPELEQALPHEMASLKNNQLRPVATVSG